MAHFSASGVEVKPLLPLLVEYEYGGMSYAFGTPAVFALSLVVGVI
jgi:NADPH:quinone reductase-like Zn-dependent oxidoreductase